MADCSNIPGDCEFVMFSGCPGQPGEVIDTLQRERERQVGGVKKNPLFLFSF